MNTTDRQRGLSLRVAGLWMVVLAIGLAVIGITLAVYQARSFARSLVAQAAFQASRIADGAQDRCEEEIAKSLTLGARAITASPTGAGSRPVSLPSWISGVYSWNEEKLTVLVATTDAVPPSDALLASLPPLVLQKKAGAPIVSINTRVETNEVIAYRESEVGRDRPIRLVAVVDAERVRSEFLESFVGGYPGLEIVPAGASREPWSQPLTGALALWAIKPTAEFSAEQQRTVLSQTLPYIGLMTFSLATLLVAMWVVARVVKRETALAAMKANFVADVSHELKTPLALIRMFAETLQIGRVTSDEKRQEYYEIIIRESTRLSNLIDNILDFSKVDSGGKEYVLEPMDVGVVVRETFEAYSAQLDRDRFEYHLSIAPKIPRIDADRDAIAQAIINLMTNAVKYSDDERYLSIEVTTDTRRGNHGVLISVHDRGIGINPQDRARVLEGFFRSEDSRVRGQRGAGLGLALVQHIVRGHGGMLDVESRLVKGSTFRVFLPESERVESEPRP